MTTSFDVVRAAGLRDFGPAPTNDPVVREDAVKLNLKRNTMLGRPGLVVHPKAKTLIKGLNGRYCYRRLQLVGRERYADKPEKNKYSHICEGLEYGCVGEGEDARPVAEHSSGSGGDRGRRVQLKFKSRRAFGR